MTPYEKAAAELSTVTKLGYAIGQMTDSIGFNLFYFFFMFFLTDYAGLSPAAAGTISLIAVIWDAVTDPVVGHISDNLRSRHGRRRPLMLAAAVPYAISTFLLLHNVDLDTGAKAIYFAAVAVLFWSSYKVFVIPFFALGAELTNDFNERTSLRAWASFFLYFAVLFTSGTTPLMLKAAGEMGYTGTQSWDGIGVIFGALTLASALICWALTKGGEPVAHIVTPEGRNGDMVSNLLDILKLRPVKILGCSVLGWAMVTAFLSSGPIYLMNNTLGYSEERISLFFTVMAVMSIIWIPLINFGAGKLDKRMVYSGAMLISTAGLAFFGLTGFGSFTALLIFISIYALGNTAFWTVHYSMMYDICELDEFINGKRREGAISALMSLFQKMGSALCLWLIGILLSWSGYNGELLVQPQSAQKMIFYINTSIPALFGLLAVVCGIAYPLTSGRFTALMTALRAKQANTIYSVDGFRELL